MAKVSEMVSVPLQTQPSVASQPLQLATLAQPQSEFKLTVNWLKFKFTVWYQGIIHSLGIFKAEIERFLISKGVKG